MLHIDGGARSGSGTIVRCAVALCSLLGEPLHLTNIRARRQRPGLQPQHLKSVEACAQMCNGRLEGASLGAQEIFYWPGSRIAGGSYQWDIGTAGSTTMLVMTVLPLACFAEGPTTLRITGGLFQDFAPSAHHMQQVLFPTLREMGLQADLKIARPGYVPRGGGTIEVRVQPVAGPPWRARHLRPLRLLEQGQVVRFQGIALSSHLRERRVSERMAQECQKVLTAKGYSARIEAVSEETSLQPGACLALWAETDTGCRLGLDRAGKPGRSSESIGRYVAEGLLEDLASGATADRYLADQLIIYAALAEGPTEYLVPRLTDHIDTNLWLVEQFGAQGQLRGQMVRIGGIGKVSPPPG